MSLGRVTLGNNFPLLRGPPANTVLGALRHPSHGQYLSRAASSAAAARRDMEGKWKKLSKEEQTEKYLEMMERVQLPQSVDPTRSIVPLLDHTIPTPLSKRPSDQSALAWLRERTHLKFQNAFHLQAVGRSPAFLGLPSTESPNQAWSTRIFGTESLNEDAWLAPLRIHALERYILMNESQAKGDVKILRTVCMDSKLRDLTRKVDSRNKDLVFAWKYNGEHNPTQCISLRTVPDEMERTHLTVIQAAMKFDTLQSVAVYNKKTGELVHEQGTAENPSKVVEYMILEKQMKHEGPWMIRAQLHEGITGDMEKLF